MPGLPKGVGIPKGMQFSGAKGGAGAAKDAFTGVIGNLRFRVLGFRVMAPDTIQKTALEEDGGPDPRPVVEGKTLNVKNNSLNIRVLRCLCRYNVFL
jgi:hypothetical protein